MAVDYSRFPARVLFSDGRLLKKAAVVVGNGQLRVAEQTPAKEVVVVYEGRLEASEKNPDRTQQLTTSDGLSLRVGKGEGCSCRSPLKAWFSQALRQAS